MGRQLEFGQLIREERDINGNYWFLDENIIYLKLVNIKVPRFIGFIMDNVATVFRNKAEHTMRVNNSYGFSIEVLKALDIEHINLYEDEAIYSFPISVLEEHGSYLHFKSQGFEIQKFLPHDIIHKYEIDYFNNPKFARRYENMGKEWFHITKKEFERPYMIRLGRFLADRRVIANVIPEPHEMFRAFKLVPYSEIKVVIVGQDPYFNEGVADGLAFSSKIPSVLPPSLAKIYETLEKEVPGLNLDRNPSLDHWAEQGILLLNRNLTVEKNNPNSHGDIGWKTFTDFVLNRLREHERSLVFLLWGSSARQVKTIVDSDKHLVLEAEHPAFAFKDAREWENNKCFTKCNSFLSSLGEQEIKWY